MFQWSTNRRRTTDSSVASSSTSQQQQQQSVSTYPAYRGSSTSTTSVETIQGSIRPPFSSSSSYTLSQHLDSYLNDATLKRSTRKIPPGDSTFDTVFQTVSGDTLILRVHIDPHTLFPTFSLAGVQAQHVWLNAQMQVTGYAPTSNVTAWKQSNLLLGQAVHAVVHEFQIRPPVILQFVDVNLRNIQPKHKQQQQQQSSSINGSFNSSSNTMSQSAAAAAHPPPPDYFSALQNVPSVDIPDVPLQFPELEALDREELDELLKDELEFQTFCHQLPYFRDTLQTLSVSVLDENAETAQHQLEQKPALTELYQQAVQLQNDLKQKVAEFQALEQEQDKLCKPPDKRKLLRDLTRAKKEAFDQSEALAEQWLELDDAGGTGVNGFVRDFMQQRQLHHVRAAKLELLESQHDTKTR